ncbi:MAG TPA: hypothetical protein VIJ51_11225 [Solirubrobacteraceae bacterium]
MGTSSKRIATGAALAIAMFASGCTIPGAALTASSSCASLMKADESTREQAIVQLYGQRYPGATGSAGGAANAVLNIEYVCGENPQQRLGNIAF